MRWQVLAIALLIACGVSVAVMANSAHKALIDAQMQFYADTRFADLFAEAKRVPRSQVSALGQIEGVAEVDARLQATGLLHLTGQIRPATARLISLSEDPERSLNGIDLVQGRLAQAGPSNEVVALKTFLDAAGLRLGDRLSATLGGRAISLVIVGAALSPEYVYVPSPDSFLPDDAHQGVLWAHRSTVERAAGSSGIVNLFAFRVLPGTRVEPLLSAIDGQLEAYGAQPAYDREDQASHAFLRAELKELSTSAVILPPIFLIVATALVHLLITRLVEVEREQIGLLKAFGYSDRAVGWNYLRLAGAIGLVGVVLGGLLGGWLGAAIVGLYREYFRFPQLAVQFDWISFALTSGFSLAAAVAGSLVAVGKAVRLSPAVAMQMPRPATFRAGLLDRILPKAYLDQATRMILRTLQRFPGRATMALAGLCASLALLVGVQFLFDSLERVVDATFYHTQRWSDSTSFTEPRARGAVASIRRMPGVVFAEPVRVVVARFRSAGHQETVRIIGLEADAHLHRPLDEEGRPLRVGAFGLVLSRALAQRLDVRPGGLIWTEIMEGRRAKVALPVVGLASDYSGLSAYMVRRDLNRLMGDGDVVSGAELLVLADTRPAFYRTIAQIPQIVGASSRDDTVTLWRNIMERSFKTSIGFYLAFAGTIAFGVTYNLGRISLSERGRDLATLQVLGFSQSDCAYILMGELALLSLTAVPLGLIGGYGLAQGLAAAYSRDEVRLPPVIGPSSYGVAILVFLVAVLVAALPVARRLWKFDLITVLKTRD
jgi:putative ABC transport system permease protein